MTDIRDDAALTPSTGRSMMQWGVIAWLVSVVLTAIGTFLDLTDNDSGDGEGDELVTWLVLIAVLGVITWVVYRYWFTPASAAPVAPNSALVAGVLALLTVVAFWTGLPAVFGVGAIVLGRRGGGPKATVGTVLAVLALAGAIWAAIVG